MTILFNHAYQLFQLFKFICSIYFMVVFLRDQERNFYEWICISIQISLPAVGFTVPKGPAGAFGPVIYLNCIWPLDKVFYKNIIWIHAYQLFQLFKFICSIYFMVVFLRDLERNFLEGFFSRFFCWLHINFFFNFVFQRTWR